MGYEDNAAAYLHQTVMFEARSILTSKDITLNISEGIFNTMLAYARAVNSEISGFGKIRETKNKISLTHVKIFEQTTSGAGTTLDAEALTKFYLSLIKTNEKPELWNCWWHSHYSFNVFFSGVDDATIEKLSRESKLYSICINQAGDSVGRVDEQGRKSDLELKIVKKINPNLMEMCKKEAEKKVKIEANDNKFTSTSFIYSPRGNFFDKETTETQSQFGWRWRDKQFRRSSS
jgi:hypothetical protein